MKFWVAGANGQVGRSVLKKLQHRSITYIATTREQVDLANEKQVMACMKEGITHIINAAGFTNVEEAEAMPEQAYLSNVIAVENLAKAATFFKARLLHISTDYVFDGTKQTAYGEEDTLNPLNWYGKTKKEGELRIQQLSKNFCILRVSRVFGGSGREFIASVLKLLQTEKEIFFASDQISRPTYVHDLAKALLFFLQREETGIYHYANQGAISKYEFAQQIWLAALRRRLPLACLAIHPQASTFCSGPAKRPLSTILDTAKIEKLLPISSWKEGFSQCFTKRARGFLTDSSLLPS